MKNTSSDVQIQTSFFQSILNWSKVELVSFTRTTKDPDMFFHQALLRDAKAQIAFSSKRIPNSCCEKVIENSGPHLINENSIETSDTKCSMMADKGFESYLGVPIFNGDLCIGALELMSAERRDWSKGEIKKLKEFSNIIHLLIRNTG